MLCLLIGCKQRTAVTPSNDFVTVKDGQFFIGDAPYYFIGTNFWYEAILGSEGEGGDRKKLIRELDFMKESGILKNTQNR